MEFLHFRSEDEDMVVFKRMLSSTPAVPCCHPERAPFWRSGTRGLELPPIEPAPNPVCHPVRRDLRFAEG
jgi:hypothetical protein